MYRCNVSILHLTTLPFFNINIIEQHLFVLIGDNELLRFLLSRGAEVDSQSDAGTPLLWAAGHVQQEAVKILLEHHADVSMHTKLIYKSISVIVSLN